MDDGHRGVLVCHHTNVTDGRNDLTMVVSLDVSLCLRMSDRLDDLNLDVMMDGNLYRHTNVMDDRNDLMMDENLDASHDLHRNDRLGDLNLDASRANRNCVRRDQMKDVNLDAMNLHVRYYWNHCVDLTIDPPRYDLSMSCDRMSHDHLLCAHLMMRRHGTNRMDVKNLDVKNLGVKMMNHHVIHRMKGDLMKVCRKMI